MNEHFDPKSLAVLQDNPAPQGLRVDTVKAFDGRRLRYAVSPSALEGTRGTVVLLQGRNEAIEKYFETMADLNARGFAVLTFDWRGQGGSDRVIRGSRLGHVKRFAHYVDDLETILREVALPDCRGPYAILAHSMGGLIALAASPQLGNIIERMVLVAPLIGFRRRRIGLRTVNRLARLATLFGFGRLSLGGLGVAVRLPDPADNPLTSDSRRYRRNRRLAEDAPHLFLDRPTISWLAAVTGAMLRLNDSDEIARLGVPALIVTAGGDRVVSSEAAERLAWRMRCGSSLSVPFARHEILQEADRFRLPLLDAFEAFVGESLPRH
ncbi:alpha/beta fold hydrolase [Aurantimonas sp. VKM B-3413]|uniref:alpha/beta fold hydrolase n=1 Tax=Aurantimonas sp. VKM B-3413 TaxID=2779401 RepID=UPI001E4987CC|nr:alpha/beta hydrolase [Aurantimonas sp. VKM B-3413]MCB8840768.1 alpha/beta hydrolase [Aurantimonas sp. VKM B-3413]